MHIVAKPDCQEDKFLFLGWAGPLEKFHFNWKMDSFTSWLGLLCQYTTTLNGCQAPLKRGLWRERRSIKRWELRDIWGQPGVRFRLAHMDAPSSFIPKCPSTQTFLLPSPLRMGILYCSTWHFFGAYLGLYILPCSFIPLLQSSTVISCRARTSATTETSLPYSSCRRSEIHQLPNERCLTENTSSRKTTCIFCEGC